jgi:regulator of RNase E activity RraA
METVSAEVLNALKEFDSATLFNAVVESMGATQGGVELEGKGGIPVIYTGPTLRCLLPVLGCAVGTVVTTEVTTTDPDSEAIPWDDYYETLDETPGPIIAVMKDVDSRPGRGACFGDGMAGQHRLCGVTGAVVEGSARDVAGIEAVGLPIWGTGIVPGHGVFNLVSVNRSITVAGLRVHPGEIMIADTDGCTKIPRGHDPEAVLATAGEIREREQAMHDIAMRPGMTYARYLELRADSGTR